MASMVSRFALASALFSTLCGLPAAVSATTAEARPVAAPPSATTPVVASPAASATHSSLRSPARVTLIPATKIPATQANQDSRNYQGGWAPAAQRPLPADNAVSGAVLQWRRLSDTTGAGFGEITQFLMQNPDWPNEDKLRKQAESAPIDYSLTPNSGIAYFNRFPPLTPGGWLRYAIALDGDNKKGDAQAAARRAWREGVLSATDEARLLSQFPGALTSVDHDARMDRLLLAGQTSAAMRTLPFTSSNKRAVFDARLAMRTRAPDAYAKSSAVDGFARNDPGYIVDRATWLRGTGNALGARNLLSQGRALTSRPSDPEEWYETLLVNARGAVSEGQYRVAYDIASQVDDAFDPGTLVREQSAGVRDDYTSLVWLAGSTAMRQLNRPRDAAIMFRKYAEAARSPMTQSKGYYWAGRAAQQAGQASEAQNYYQTAAQHFDQFYGQLALERLGRPQPRPAPPATASFSGAERNAFQNRSVVRAARILGQQGDWKTQSLFVRAIANFAKSDADHYFAARLAEEIARPDLSVMVGRSARLNGLNDFTPTAFPTVNVPPTETDQWTMIHAIARQESQFDKRIISRAGATGLMQLMPGTARETAGKLGMGYGYDQLYDPTYNIMLGSTYFRGLMNQFGSYPLAVAAYNAGPGNVRKWLRNNGDPRSGSISILDWIEAIPLSETRGYVHHVLENAVVYDTINPNPKYRHERNPLSFYLGKANNPG